MPSKDSTGHVQWASVKLAICLYKWGFGYMEMVFLACCGYITFGPPNTGAGEPGPLGPPGIPGALGLFGIPGAFNAPGLPCGFGMGCGAGCGPDIG